jgi:hypothetical protein
MDSNTHSIEEPGGLLARPSDGLAELATAVESLAAQDLDGLPDPVRAERVLVLRRLLDRLEGHWLAELAGVDARGAAGADQDVRFGSTVGWLRARLHMGASAVHHSVRTARALFRGPLTATAQALTDGELSPAHANVLAHGTHDLPHQLTAEAEPVLVEAARRLDPPRLRQVIGHLQLAADPDGAQAKAERRHGRRGLWLSPTLEGMVAVDGLLEAEAGQTLLAALEPLARPHSAADDRSGGQRRADALAELARRQLEAGRLPRTGGVRPQLTVLVDLDSLQGRAALGGDTELGPLPPETCRRLACDGAVTRVLVTRHGPGPNTHPDDLGEHDHTQASGHHDPCGDHGHHHPDSQATLTDRLRAAARRLPPVLGGAPTQPLDLGRTTRVVSPAQRTALAVRDGGCVFPGCDRPWPGARPTISSIGWMAARPIWTTWSCCAGPTIGPSMRAAGGWPEARTGGRPPPHRIDHPEDSRPQHDRRGRAPTSSWPARLAPGAPTRR